MCFSATASFTSAALLVTAGGITTLKNRSKPHRMIAAVPLLFGIQQAAEGLVWISLGSNSPSALQSYSAFVFMFFAIAFWPAWVPWSIYLIERKRKRKKIVKLTGIIGLTGSFIATTILLTSDIKPYVTGHSIAYALINFKRYWPANLEFLVYIIPTLLPFFISSARTLRLTGYLIAASMILSQIINQEASASVWCFFAAGISFYIAIYVIKIKNGKLS